MVNQRTGMNGRFFGLRIDCERVPMIPAWIVRWVLDDPVDGQYLLVWKNQWSDGIGESVRIKRVAPPACFPDVEAIEIWRSERSITDVHVFRRPLPRNGGNDVFLECPGCRKFRRALYGWAAGGLTTRSAFKSQWQCRECAGLRYASEGGALVIRPRGFLRRMFGVERAKRPEPRVPCTIKFIPRTR